MFRPKVRHSLFTCKVNICNWVEIIIPIFSLQGNKRAVYLCNKTERDMKTKVFEIKIGRTWVAVRATSMQALNTYCQSNGIKQWRMVGMMSIAETAASQSLKVVA